MLEWLDNKEITLVSSPEVNTCISYIWLQLHRVRLGRAKGVVRCGYFSLEPQNY